MMHIADNQELLLDYLYEEGDPAERLRTARHLQECTACSVAVLEFQSVRELLAEWTPPAARLGFKVVPAEEHSSAASAAPPTPAPRQPRFSLLGAGRPAWAQAAAAAVLFAAGMAVSQLQFEYGNGALTVRSRAHDSAVVVAADTMGVMHPGSDIVLPPTLVRASDSTSGSDAPSAAASADEVLRRVKSLIDQSESRQQRELALRLADVVRDFDTQRQADLRQVQQNFGQLEAQTGAEVAQQRGLINSLVKVSQGGVK